MYLGLSTKYVWKFQDFSALQILREINFGDSTKKFKNFRLLYVVIHRGSEFYILVNFTPQAKRFNKIKIQSL